MNYMLSIIKVLCLEKIANRYIMIDIISISNCLFVYLFLTVIFNVCKI